MQDVNKEYEYFFHFALRGGFSGVVQVQTTPTVHETIDDWIEREIDTVRSTGSELGLQHFAGTGDDILIASIHREEKDKEKVVDAPEGREGKEQVVYPVATRSGPAQVMDIAETIRKQLEQGGLEDVQIKEITKIDADPPDTVQAIAYHAARAEEIYTKIDEALARFVSLMDQREGGSE